MTASRNNTKITAKLALVGAVGFGSLVALAAPALAETPANEGQEMVLVMPQPEPDTTDDLAAPQPEDTTDDIAAPQPAPQPQPEGPGELVQPTGHGDPEPNDDKVGPNQDDEDEDRPEDLVDGGCHFTHGCDPERPEDLTNGDGGDEDECHPLQASCDLTAGDPGEPGDDDSSDDETEVEGSSTDRGSLPRTGAGIVLLAGVGSALTAAGAALRKAARR